MKDILSNMKPISNSDDILTFIKVVQKGSFQAAADALQISSSLASKRISRLEANLNAQLLHRTTRHLTLTEIGRHYFNNVQSIPLQLQSAFEQTIPLNDAMQGHMKIIVPYGFDNSIKQHVLPQFMHDYPDITIELQVVMNPADHLNEDFDLLVNGKRPNERFPDTNLVRRKLLDLPAGVYASKQYLQQHKRPNKPKDLLQHRCLSFIKGDDWPFIDKGGNTTLVHVDSALHSNSSGLLQGMTINHCGICYGFDFMFADGLADGSIVKILEQYVPKTMMECYLFYHQTEYMPAKTRELINRLLAVYHPYR